MPRLKKLKIRGFKSFASETEIPLPSGFNALCGPNGSGKCVTGDTLIQLSSGDKKEIKKLVENALEESDNVIEENEEIKTHENPENLKIISMDPETLELEKRKVDAFVKIKSPEKILRIKTKSGREIKTTDYHPLFTVRNESVEKVKGSELEEGMKIATPRKLPIENHEKELEEIIDKTIENFEGQIDCAKNINIPYNSIKGVKDSQAMNLGYFSKITQHSNQGLDNLRIKAKNHHKAIEVPKELDEDLASVLGYLISEGRNTIFNQIWFVNANRRLIEDFQQKMKKVFDIEGDGKDYKGETKDILFYSKALCSFFGNTFDMKMGGISKEKTISSSILESNKNVLTSFTSSLIDGDGYISKEGYFEYSTASNELARSLFSIFLRFNIQPLLRKKIKSSQNMEEPKEYYSIFIYGNEQMIKLKNILDLKGAKRNRIEEVTNRHKKDNPNMDLIPGINNLIKEVKEDLGINIKIARKEHPKLAAYIEKRCEVSRGGLKEIINFFETKLEINNSPNKEGIEEKINYLKKFCNSDIYWDEITKIEEIKPEEDYVYDLCIKGNHNFVAEDIIVHNSNIVDAITFALGTLSTKSIRAGKLEDLIYNGTDKDVNQAEVSLIIDNSSGKINIDSDKDDIKITRKINKSGNSIYKMDGKTVTRKRITNILSDARIQPDGHNIIMQGDITQLIEMNSKERREIIDEISGIADFDDKKEQAEKELEKVEDKLNEARIVLNEKKNNLEKLEKEKRNAEKYQRFEEELEKLKTSILHQKLDEKEGEVEEIREKYEEKKEELGKIKEEYEEKDQKLEDLQEEEENIRQEMVEKGQNQDLVESIHEIKSKIERKRDKIENNDNEIGRIDKTIEKLKRMEKEKEVVTGKGAVKEILKLNKEGVEGTIASLANVKEKYQTPIEIAAGSRLNNIIVENDRVASDCIEHLKQNNAGRATFLPLNKLKPRDKSREAKRLKGKDGIIDFAINLIDYDSKYELAFRYVFQDTLVVKDLKTARKHMGKARMVTLDGDIIHKSGAMVGGKYKSKKSRQTKLSDSSGKSDEIKEYKEKKRDLKEEIEILRKKIGSLNEKLDELNDKKEEESGEMDEMEDKQEEIQEEIKEIREERKGLYEKKSNLQNKVNKLNIKKAKIEASVENLDSEIVEEDDEDLDIYDDDLENLEKRKKETLNELNQLGPVNMRALEEYDSVKTVYKTLKGKVDKIEEEKDAILDTVNRIEKERKDRFMETFNTVNGNFQEIFHEITQGDGSLELGEEGNIKSGLLIKARPKGKETLNLDSMSGGEKAVTALSFLFAVQRYKPAPFYILDEIDAALDDKNTKKIASLIQKYSEDAQFITITHNDVTIEMADRVYGVTMDNGISKVLSIEMPEDGE